MQPDLESQRGTVGDRPGSPIGSSTSWRVNLEVTKKTNQLILGWKDINYSVEAKSGRKQILYKVSGLVEKGIIQKCFTYSGQMLAILGPPGSGKTTLLNILSRRLTDDGVTGEQMLSGAPFENSALRGISTYVEQEDHLIGSLTVHETLGYAAKLALGRKVTTQQRRERTEEMLKNFCLSSVRDKKIGTPFRKGISKSQKRRVTIASQLIALPKIIFLGKLSNPVLHSLTVDEPTTGLDGTSSKELMSCLRNTAREYGVKLSAFMTDIR